MTKKPELVYNWKKLFKSYTVILSVIFAMANLIMGGLFILTPFFDAKVFAGINFFFYMIVGIGRMVKQGNLDFNPPPSPYTPQPYAQTVEEEEKANSYDNPDG